MVFKNLFFFFFASSCLAKFQPTWDSLDTRKTPSWYDEAKFGIFIHWGVFSVPSFYNEWFWKNLESGGEPYKSFMENTYKPNFTYQDFGSMFKAELFNATEWTEIFSNAGARYVVLTTKHHEGFTLWPSKHSFGWNSKDIGPNRDLVGELASALRSGSGIKFGTYHSMFEWFNPLYIRDRKNFYHTQYFVYSKTLPELYELVNMYHPDIVWSDGQEDALSTYWNSTTFLAWLYNDSPVKKQVVVNDRWGGETMATHGDFYTVSDRFNPGYFFPHKWEAVFSIDKTSFGFSRMSTVDDYMNEKELIRLLARTVSCNGNLLLNIGPRSDGTIDMILQWRLKQIGSWLQTNGQAIFKTHPWIYVNDNEDVWYTAATNEKGDFILYAILLEWPKNQLLYLSRPNFLQDTSVTLLGTETKQLLARPAFYGIFIDLSDISPADLQHTSGWVIRFLQIDASQRKFHEGIS